MQLPLALHLPAPEGTRLSGILFRPSVHYHLFEGIDESFGEKVNRIRKNVLYRFMLSNRALGRVLSLDPFFAEYAKDNYPDGHKVMHLPDPTLFPLDEYPCVDHDGLLEDVPRGRRRFLFFGALAGRKGIFEILRALGEMEPGSAEQTALIFAGKYVDADREEFLAELEGYRSSGGRAHISLIERFLSEEEIVFLLRKCDAVLAPYQRFVGSSGVLMAAAGAGKPMITQDYGLVGRLTRQYGLGMAVDTRMPVSIARAMERVIHAERPGDLADRQRMRELVEQCSLERFLNAFFKGVAL